MIRVVFDDVKRLHSFLRVSSLDYVDFLLHGEELSLVMDSSEVFAMLVLKAAKSENQDDVKFRIHRNLLASLSQGDALEITADGSDVTIAFYGGQGILNYYCKFTMQVVAEFNYRGRIEMVRNLSDGASIDSEGLEKLYRIAKYNHGLVNVDGGVASVLLRSGERIYHPVKTGLSFAFTSDSFECLRKCDVYFSSVEEYLIAGKDNFFVAARKARLDRNSEYGLIAGNKFGSKYIAEIHLGSLFSFLARMKTDISALELNVETEDCRVEIGDTVFNIPVRVRGSRLAPGAEIGVVRLPTKTVSSILNLLGSNVFTIKVKKNYVQFEFEDYIVVV